MAKITQVGPGRKTKGTIDGITYVTRKGVTYARSAPNMPASAYKTPSAKKRQAVFLLVQMHMKFHGRTIKQTFSPKDNGTPYNRYYHINAKALALALDALAERYVAGEVITITEVEAAIGAYAAENPTAIIIGHLNGYRDVYLTGEWPATITLNASTGDSTVIIIVNEYGVATTINADGTVTTDTNSAQGGASPDPSQRGENQGGSSETVASPTISGSTSFSETTSVTMSAEAGAEIRYTTDGSTPTASSTLYASALTLSATTTVKAIAIKDGVSSEVTTKTFTKSSGAGDDAE